VVKGRWFAALLALVAPAAITAQAPVAAPATEPTPDWRASAQQDVRAAYDIFAENHPGMHDPTNRAFPAQLARARDKALAAAARGNGRRGYVEALGAFSAELSDGHALVYSTSPAGTSPGENRWPGFVAAWRGDRMVVHHAGPGSPAPTGSQIVSCDGRPIAQVVRSRLRASASGRARPAIGGRARRRRSRRPRSSARRRAAAVSATSTV
jgi:hypothetical protein